VNASEFFAEHAGFSYDPKTQTEEQGKQECALALASAEQWAREQGISFAWEIDPDITSADWSDELPAWDQWQCIAYSADGEIVGCIGGVDFGLDGSPHSDPHRRVIEAEIALECRAESGVAQEHESNYMRSIGA
jgi:hypothetical protein